MKMKKYISGMWLPAFLVLFMGCNDWLERDPKDILTEDQVYSSVGNITAVTAGIYNRLIELGGIDQDPVYYTHLDEAMLGQNVNNFISFPNNYGEVYKNVNDENKDASAYKNGYVLIRDINYHLKRLEGTSVLKENEKAYYLAEGRFLRVYVYFELVKRMGGVPLFDELVQFDPDDDLTEYQRPRETEQRMYDFISSEIEAIKDALDLPVMVQYNRASKGAALALKSRAMLYAGSLARYNSQMGIPLELPGKEVGIPASEAQRYFQESLKASEELIAMGKYDLYNRNEDKSRNFFEALITSPKAGNPEIIFMKEFALPSTLHNWTYNNLSRTLREGGFNGTGGTYINPSLNLADAYERTNGTSGKLNPYTTSNHRDEIGDESQLDGDPNAYIYYGDLQEIYKDRDPRLAGTFILPGSSFGGKNLDLKAGVAYFNEQTGKLEFKTGSLEDLNNNYLRIDNQPVYENGEPVGLTGLDGPSTDTYCTRTGFYVRKSMDESPAGELKKSTVPFVRYRMAEVYLNAAEAAFELGSGSDAVKYLKKVRDRAGIATGASTTLEQIRNERRVELAFEGHRYFDLKRWRMADEVFDGNVSTPTAMIAGLWPYKVYRPGHETHGKWIYVRRIPTVFTAPRKFVRANYYSAFPDDVLTANPKLIKNPGH